MDCLVEVHDEAELLSARRAARARDRHQQPRSQDAQGRSRRLGAARPARAARSDRHRRVGRRVARLRGGARAVGGRVPRRHVAHAQPRHRGRRARAGDRQGEDLRPDPARGRARGGAARGPLRRPRLRRDLAAAGERASRPRSWSPRPRGCPSSAFSSINPWISSPTHGAGDRAARRSSTATRTRRSSRRCVRALPEGCEVEGGPDGAAGRGSQRGGRRGRGRRGGRRRRGRGWSSAAPIGWSSTRARRRRGRHGADVCLERDRRPPGARAEPARGRAEPGQHRRGAPGGGTWGLDVASGVERAPGEKVRRPARAPFSTARGPSRHDHDPAAPAGPRLPLDGTSHDPQRTTHHRRSRQSPCSTAAAWRLARRLCPRDPRARARAARARVPGGARRSVVRGGVRRVADDLRGAPDAAHPVPQPDRRPAREAVPQARGPAPRRRAQDEPGARPGAARAAAWASGGSSPRPGPASTASRPP